MPTTTFHCAVVVVTFWSTSVQQPMAW